MPSDEELTALALAADPDAPLPLDAVPFVADDADAGLLPDWYMPAPGRGRRLSGWRRRVVLVLVVTFLLIEAVGLCSTYGYVTAL